jgi:hypothetical protein
MSNLKHIDTKRQYLQGKSEPSDFIEIAINRRDRKKGSFKVKFINLLDGKYQELETFYVSMLEISKQVDLEKKTALELEAKKLGRQLRPADIARVERKFSSKRAEAQAAFYEAKKEFCRYAVVDIETFTFDGKIISYSAEQIKDEVDGKPETLTVMSAATIEALESLPVGYGSKRYPAITNLFEACYDYQNGIITNAANVWAESEKEAAKEASEAMTDEAEKALESNETGEAGKASPLG